MVWNFGKKVATAALNRHSGRTDVLEGMCSVAALAAGADGTIKPEEVDQALNSTINNEKMRLAFQPTQIGEVMNRQIGKMKTPSGKFLLERELTECAGMDLETRQDIFFVGLDVAAGDGHLDDKEKEVLRKAAGILGLQASDYGL